ncbi:hypothetical protein JQ604_29225 [Bradyrhizobium jicamae]|uniref:hypothetical protein n=1 Tax=Bradyrhizobium jicamae TaxID=280332 RepID=UPI001BACE5C7|nr:hypothetical protein [Bradyrhizobium jicamae]MBR0756278.1 hypothetical protein [Bradyrhizobium jicamae]
MTRAITIAALTCVLVAGAAATAIIARDSMPTAGAEVAAGAPDQAPVSNKASKKDKLAVATLAMAAYEPPQQPAAPSALQLQAQAAIPVLNNDPLRQAYASAEPGDVGLPKLNDQAAAPAAPQPAKPKAAAKPAPQKNYALLSDVQIAGIKERLKLSAAQESYWPPVETALRAVARKIHAKRQADPSAGGMPIDPDSAEVQQLKSAAMPLLFQLREDQKNEVRQLARIIGLDKVAAMI